ncbi:hypothetical protein LCGC14_0095680 [marine sediment metagenome]|uniref:Histidine kinase domain-containing protein n=1 Tax=marine sediment metagenome TaxID=412755 RepID=A0A0F9VHV1_9ZZZZ|nr:HAMP domain-containing histidine kinase [Phycisphaerae bacterium]HDZ44153.1 HAMP domain-containing histidine kinase [Phycisphaerae bacterium]
MNQAIGLSTGHEDALAKLAQEVKELREHLRRSQRMASIGTMTAMMVHEFNNILTPIITYAEMARHNPDLTDKAIDKAARGGERAQTVCRALLGLCRGDEVQRVEANVAELVSLTVEAIARHPNKDGIDLPIAIPADLTLSTRPVELQQVLLNLILNARRAVLAERGSGRIAIDAHQEDGSCVLRVCDNGVGIESDDLARIFEPFFSTADRTDKDAGFGLGLTVCREIVQSLGGTITVDSTVGEGTTFTLTLPTQ